MFFIMEYSRFNMLSLVIFGMSQVQSKILTDTARTVTKNKDVLRVTCLPTDTSDFEEILFIRLRSDRDEPFSSRKSKIARISKDYGLQYAKWIDRQRYSIAGNLTEMSSSFLSLEILPSEVECEDTATYRCEMVYKMLNGSYVTTFSENPVSVSDIDEAVSKVERVNDDSPNGDSVHHVTCSVFTGNATRDIYWCSGVGQETKEESVLNIESERRNITQHRQCTFLIQNEVTVKTEDYTEITWLACSLRGCQNIKESKKYYLPKKNGNEKFQRTNFLVQSDMYYSGEEMEMTTKRDITAFEFPEMETNIMQSCSQGGHPDRKYMIAGLSLATFGFVALVMSILVYCKARRVKSHKEKREPTFEQQSKDLSISYSKIDEDTRHRYIWISKSVDNIRDDNPYSSLGDLNKFKSSSIEAQYNSLGDLNKNDETKTSYMSMVVQDKGIKEVVESEPDTNTQSDIYVRMS